VFLALAAFLFLWDFEKDEVFEDAWIEIGQVTASLVAAAAGPHSSSHTSSGDRSCGPSETGCCASSEAVCSQPLSARPTVSETATTT